MANAPPPRPPPHGASPRPPGGLPDGNYDIFIIPPHSAGSGFLYLPSLQPQRNSFLAGVACTLLAVGLYVAVVPAINSFLSAMRSGGGFGLLLLAAAIGVVGWAVGKTQAENNGAPGPGGGSADGAAGRAPGAGFGAGAQRASPESKSPPRTDGAASGWEKARQETKRRDEERKRAEESKRKADETQEAARAAKVKAEKDKLEQARAREKDQREREARERIAREKLSRETNSAKPTASARSSPSKPSSRRYEKPTASSYAGEEEEYSFRPYDKKPSHHHKSSASSVVSGVSEGSYAASHSTSRTTPPPSSVPRGPYSTNDPEKIQLRAVYLFTDSFPLKPVASLVAGSGAVTDGLILRLTTEGLFIDDDVRRVPQREWDIKAWTLKLVEDGACRSPLPGAPGLHVLRATARDADNKKYTFVLDESEAWKVALGLQRLRKGSQVRSLGMSGMKESEMRGLLTSLAWI